MSGDLWASRLLMSQWPNSTSAHRISEATQFSISSAPASTSRASKKAEKTFTQLAQFSQPKTEAPSPIEALADDRNKEGDPEFQRVLEERDKEGDSSCATPRKLDEEGDAVGDSLEMLTTAAELLLGPTKFLRFSQDSGNLIVN